MLGYRLRGIDSPRLLTEDELEGMTFNTPVPYYDMPVACGNPSMSGDVPKAIIMMPDEIVGTYNTYCTRADGDSMLDLGIQEGDLLLVECVPAYYNGDIVVAEIDGEKTLKTYWVDEEGVQWLVPANSKYKPLKLDATMQITFRGRLISHIRKAPHDSVEHIVASIGEARAALADKAVKSEKFSRLAVNPECAGRVIGRLHELMAGKLKPRDILMPLRAAMAAGAIRRPTWAEFCLEFGSKLVSKTSLSDYTDPTKDKYGDEPTFLAMVADFRQLI